MAVAPRTVTHLLERYDELLTLSLTDTARLQRITQAQGRVILALDGLQPDVGHEVLWVLRDCLSGEVLLARSLLSATQPDLAALLRTVRQNLQVPIVGIVSDGQLSIRGAVAEVFPECHTNCVTSIIFARRRSPFTMPTAMPRKNSRSVSAGYAPSNGASKDGTVRKPRWREATVPRSAVPSRMMDAHPGRLGAQTPRPPHRDYGQSRAGRKRGPCPRLRRLKDLLARGLRDTADLWPDVQ